MIRTFTEVGRAEVGLWLPTRTRTADEWECETADALAAWVRPSIRLTDASTPQTVTLRIADTGEIVTATPRNAYQVLKSIAWERCVRSGDDTV